MSKLPYTDYLAKGWKDIMEQHRKDLEKTPWWKFKEVAAIRSNYRYAQHMYMQCTKMGDKEKKAIIRKMTNN